MAEFEVPIVKIEEVIPIEGADRIEAVRVGGYQSIVEKGKYFPGMLAVYIPCGSVVPMDIQEDLGLVGKLSGNRKDRVKEIKLKGVLSEGLIYSFDKLLYKESALKWQQESGVVFAEGADVAAALGITKYEPPIPAQMAGHVKPYPFTMNYDIENFKKHPNVLQEGEEVYISEKIHGTLLQVGYVFDQNTGEYTGFVTSKGLGEAGIIIKDNEANVGNLYIKVAKAYGLLDKIKEWAQNFVIAPPDIYLFGEVYGQGIQDLGYAEQTDKEPKYRAFDIYFGKKCQGSWLNVAAFTEKCNVYGIPYVNYIYHGPFFKEELKKLTSGKESMSGKELHMREGVVVRPAMERVERQLGRVILKSVSEEYLLRKGGTEYN